MSYLFIFGLELQNFVKKQKSINLGPKVPFLGIFDQKCFIWVFLGNTIVRFEISAQKMPICKFSRKNKNA